MTTPLLEVENLSVEYRRGRQRNMAVKDVSFTIGEGETVGLVGESGSGKSTIGKAILGLVPAHRGTIEFAGRDITNLSRSARNTLTKNVQVVYQDPYSSLDPTKPIGYTLAEPIQVHDPAPRGVVTERVVAMLRRVGLGEDAARRYPAQFSGGQRQRIAVARALILSPKLVVCDEPVSALDLSIQAEVINLIASLQKETGASFLFISHDLSVVHHISDRLVVLKNGAVVEQGEATEVYRAPQDDYTRRLIAAAPVPDPDEQARRNDERLGTPSDERSAAVPTAP
ncbi:ATP-binding cassette domain-containing protein [Paramicrobacterium fandaimingii]|uniref:ATP-binding cassette domain-containing protein n=1 Tax=Paramicrobacterium fandaimingii TaxID=2708079 RepID=UPI001423B088|nr:ATP-binding cassette domain-containing protein [Microbacterium fandaimingii]